MVVGDKTTNVKCWKSWLNKGNNHGGRWTSNIVHSLYIIPLYSGIYTPQHADKEYTCQITLQKNHKKRSKFQNHPQTLNVLRDTSWKHMNVRIKEKLHNNLTACILHLLGKLTIQFPELFFK